MNATVPAPVEVHELGVAPPRRDPSEPHDPRVLQVGFLGAFLAVVALTADFAPSAPQVAVTLGAALATQEVAVRALALPRPGMLSPLISGLSLCLLLRSGSLLVPALAAGIAIASKFLVRFRGKHVFNPSLAGLVAVLLLTRDAWTSPGQWGTGALLTFGIVGLGGTVVNRVGRADISLAFLGTWLGLLLARAAWLGHPVEVFWHQSLSGAVLLFAFFMISDPRSTPDARAGRILFAVLVAVVAFVLRFEYHEPNAIFWSLFALSPLTPLFDQLFRRSRFEWSRPVALSRR